MVFEWDEEASEAAFASRGFDFAFACRIFRDATLERAEAKGNGERRVGAIGDVDGQTVYVVYADQGGARRILTARPASRKERKRWLSFVRL